MKPITLLLAEDHQIVREGLRSLLELEGDIQVIGEAATGRQAVQMARRLRPDVIVLDIAMPELNGLEAARQIRRETPETRVLILSAHNDEGYVDQVLALGAAGFLLKQTSSNILVEAVRHVAQGGEFFSPSIAKRVHAARGPVPDQARPHGRKGAGLTSREVEVLQLIAEGRANKQVAAELGISVKTVEKHRQRVMERLGIHDTAGLTRYAIAAGISESSIQLTIQPGPG